MSGETDSVASKTLSRQGTQIRSHRRPDLKKDSNVTSVRYAYVTFRSMDSVNKVIDAYNISDRYRCCINCCCFCCYPDEAASLKEKEFKGNWLEIEKACEPE